MANRKGYNIQSHIQIFTWYLSNTLLDSSGEPIEYLKNFCCIHSLTELVRSTNCLYAHFTDLIRLCYKLVGCEIPGARVNLKLYLLAACCALAVVALLLQIYASFSEVCLLFIILPHTQSCWHSKEM